MTKRTEIKIDRVIETQQDLMADPVYTEIFRGFVNRDADMRVKDPNWKSDWKGYVSGNKIYEAYMIDGMKYLKQISLHSMISDSPFQEVVIFPDHILIQKSDWAKTESNRKLITKFGYRVF